MPYYVGLLRAVNVGGSGPVTMESLRELLARLGLEEVRSLIQSGNAVFRSAESEPAALERSIEGRLDRDLGLRTDVFVRGATEWSSIISRNPFPKEAAADPSHLVVTFLKAAPTPARWKALEAAISGRERVRGDGRHAYIVYPDGLGTSRLTGAVIERSLETRGTSRNWNTVGKLGAMLASPEKARSVAH